MEAPESTPHDPVADALSDNTAVGALAGSGGSADHRWPNDHDALHRPALVSSHAIGLPRPKIWPLPLILFVSLLFYLLASVFAVAIAAFAVHGHLSAEMFRSADALQKLTQSRIGFPLIVVIPQVAMIIPTLLAASTSALGIRRRLRLLRGHWPLWGWTTAALATPLIGMISSAVVGLFMEDSESLLEMSHIFRDLAAEGFLLPLALLIGATPGICEELLFRGYVQSRLTARYSGVWGILLTSIVFAAFHMDLVHSTAVFALGVWLGWICWQSGSLFPAMLAHFINNAVSVCAVALGPEPGSDEVSLTLAGIMLSVFAIGIASLFMTVVCAWRYRDPQSEIVAPSSAGGIPGGTAQTMPTSPDAVTNPL